jgi:hypothetical protein
MSRTSGRVRWTISATVCACTFPGVDRCSISCPSKLRLREALKLAKRTSELPAVAGAARRSADAATANASARRVNV